MKRGKVGSQEHNSTNIRIMIHIIKICLIWDSVEIRIIRWWIWAKSATLNLIMMIDSLILKLIGSMRCSSTLIGKLMEPWMSEISILQWEQWGHLLLINKLVCLLISMTLIELDLLPIQTSKAVWLKFKENLIVKNLFNKLFHLLINMIKVVLYQLEKWNMYLKELEILLRIKS